MSALDRLDYVDFGAGTSPNLSRVAQGASKVAAAPATDGEERSEAQMLFDRFLEQCNRFNRQRKRLDEVATLIAPSKAQKPVFPESVPQAPINPRSFFDGLHMLADGIDRAADDIDRSLEHLNRLF